MMNAADVYRDIPGTLQPVVVVKTTDETVNDSSTLQDDNELKFYVEPHSVWTVDWWLYINSGTTPDFKFQIDVPTSSTGGNTVVSQDTGGTLIGGNLDHGASVGIVGSGAAKTPLLLRSLVIVAATAGFVKFTWAQNTANASDTKVLAGSTLMAWNLTPYKVKA